MPSRNPDDVWTAAGMFSKKENPRPNWSGFMLTFSKGSHPPNSVISMLPIIDLSPSDPTCIYSTLLFVIEQSRKLNVSTPCLTFDEPLWRKAFEIVIEKSLNVVVNLGGFHTLMSYAGSIGSMMDGSGLEDALQTVYGENAVQHMLRGKAIAMAIRGHILVEAALTKKLQNMLCDTSVITTDDLVQIEETCRKVEAGELELSEVDCPAIAKLQKSMEDLKDNLSKESRTAKLWIQYLEYVSIMRQFIRAAREGNWHLYLFTMEKMLNLFAGTGHINYAKSARLYLQSMLELPTTHPSLYEKFAVDGYHVIRRTNRFWAGLWPDLTIEQVRLKCRFFPSQLFMNIKRFLNRQS